MITRGDPKLEEEFWESLYRVDARDAWLNAGYDECGEAVPCDVCGDEMRFDAENRIWVCPGCGRPMSRAQWFNYISADPPGAKCLSLCGENYPMCKRWCPIYKIDSNDPMM